MNWFLGTSLDRSCVKFSAELDVLDLAAEHLGEAALEASGDKQDSQVRSCLSLMLETDICEVECLPGPHLYFRLEEVQGRCCRSWLIVCVFSLLTFTFWLPFCHEVCFDKRAYAVKHVFPTSLPPQLLLLFFVWKPLISGWKSNFNAKCAQVDRCGQSIKNQLVFLNHPTVLMML